MLHLDYRDMVLAIPLAVEGWRKLRALRKS